MQTSDFGCRDADNTNAKKKKMVIILGLETDLSFFFFKNSFHSNKTDYAAK